MPKGVLYLVATPIGNLEDVTFRAVRVLSEVAVIAAEDTRRTGKLLRHYEIKTPTLSLHEHNERRRTPAVISRLESGASVALVADAGTPLLSDPGTHLVKTALAAGIKVESVPGASAILSALVASGLAEAQFTFAGFPPSRSNARQRWLATLSEEQRPIILFEAPHRIVKCLDDIAEVLGDRQVAVCRELTKVHEKLVIGPISSISNGLNSLKGEFTLVVAPRKQTRSPPSTEEILSEFGDLTDSGTVRRDAVKQVAKRHGLAARDVYRLVESNKT